MKLRKAKVQKYKCIEDSGEWQVDQVTCLVGKNEAGKSALLEALYKLNPVDMSYGVFTETDYPRRSALTNEGKQDLENAKAIITEWALDPPDVALLEEEIPELKISEDAIIEISKGYDGKRTWNVSINETLAVDTLIESAHFNAAEKSAVGSPETIYSLFTTLEAITEPTDKQNNLLASLKSKYPKKSAMSGVWTSLSKNLPYFVYFREYERLPGKVSINELIQLENEDKLTFGMKIFQALLELANSSASSIADAKESEKLIMQLEGVSNRLTDEIFEYWSQNKHLRVEFRCDMGRPDDPSPFNDGWVFQTRIRNERHRATVNFDERSTGFIWFFSFLVWFSQVRDNYGENLVVLLDEPGLTLHGKAQQDLLRYIREKLQPHYQVLYTTHSPFMLDVENVFSLRSVEDRVEREIVDNELVEHIHGTKVGQEVLSRDRDTILPLQGLIGYDIARTLFIGPYVVVVEGPSEIPYIEWFTRALLARGRTGLDIRWAVAPAEGAPQVSSFVTLFKGRGLKIAALLDYHDGQKKLVDRLEQSKLLEDGYLLKTTDFVDQADSDIEDLIGWEMYAHLVNGALQLPESHKLPNDKPQDSNSRVVKAVENMAKLFPPGIPEFDHFKASEYLCRLSEEDIQQIPGLDYALDKFEALFVKLNELIG